jgi:hypothetical protein
MGYETDKGNFGAAMKRKARHLYEVDGLSKQGVVDALKPHGGPSLNTIKKWVKDYKWKARGQRGQELAEIEEKAAVDEAKALGITRARILKEYSIIGFSNIKDFTKVLPGGKVVPKSWDELSDEQTRAIKKLRVATTEHPKLGIIETNFDIDLFSKENALEKMGTEIGMFRSPELEQIAEHGVLAFFRDAAKTRDAKRGKS